VTAAGYANGMAARAGLGRRFAAAFGDVARAMGRPWALACVLATELTSWSGAATAMPGAVG